MNKNLGQHLVLAGTLAHNALELAISHTGLTRSVTQQAGPGLEMNGMA